jgi:Flp pilus assembly protein TadD
LKQGRWKEARAAYEEAHRLGPEAIHVLAHLSISLSVGADPDSARAVDLIDRAVELAREDDRPLLAKAKVLSNVGRTEDARSLLRELAARRTLHGVTKKEVAKVMREIG